jgi:predicted N-acyltransferase
MTFCCTLHESVAEIADCEWKQVTAGASPFAADRRLIVALERAMVGQARCWTIAIREGGGRMAAVACLVLFTMDMVETGPPWLRRIAARARRWTPGLLRFKVLFCGLPVPGAQHHLFVAPDADRTEVLRMLHKTMRELGRKHRARMLIVKEFDLDECAWMAELEQMGYIRGELPVEHLLTGEFDSFDAYRAALKARYRQQVIRSEKKLRQQGLTVKHLRGPAIAQMYTDEVHALYLAVHARSRTKLELLPASLFRELAQQFGDDASLTVIQRPSNGQIVAFTFALRDADGGYHNLYSGLDYQLNPEADLYFNLFYHDLDYAFRHGASVVHLGQTSDDFKARLGSTQRRVYCFARATGNLLNIGFRRIAQRVFLAVHHAHTHEVFKERPK